MIALVRTWLLGVTAAAILAALAEHMMPEGGVKQVGKLVCGLMLAAAVLRPLGELNVTEFALPAAYDGQYVQELRAQQNDRMKTVIEAELSAYSTDKAGQLGLPCRVQIVCRQDTDGVFLPDSAQLTGELTPEQRNQLAQCLREELGLDGAVLVFVEEGQG